VPPTRHHVTLETLFGWREGAVRAILEADELDVDDQDAVDRLVLARRHSEPDLVVPLDDDLVVIAVVKRGGERSRDRERAAVGEMLDYMHANGLHPVGNWPQVFEVETDEDIDDTAVVHYLDPLALKTEAVLAGLPALVFVWRGTRAPGRPTSLEAEERQYQDEAAARVSPADRAALDRLNLDATDRVRAELDELRRKQDEQGEALRRIEQLLLDSADKRPRDPS
jgi:hypothetical protein